jgi:phosphoglycolate phosphatase-like HAD superfamily hydrolase
MRRTRLGFAGSLFGLICLSSLGCSGPVLTVNDAVVMGGTQSPVTAYVERPVGLGFRHAVKEVPVEFSAGNREIGVCETQNRGQASVLCDLPQGGCSQFEAIAIVKGKTVTQSGCVFRWDPRRTVVAVDVDHTLSLTAYLALLFKTRDRHSRPIPGAVETMNALARDYQIAYVTSRPRFLLERTRQWLREEGFPAGPVIVSSGWAEWRNQGAFKRRRLADLRQQWPNLLIGIGDKQSDVGAYTANGMLTLIVNEKRPDRYGEKAVTSRDWAALAQFFADNRAVLTQPAVLASRIDAGGRLIPPAPDLMAAARPMPPGSQRPQALRMARGTRLAGRRG